MTANDKKLLQEWTPLTVTPDLIKEIRAQNNGRIVLKGILQRADALNQNGRIYPKPILEREVRNYQKFVRERRAMGEADHPDQSVIEIKNVSHIVTEISMDEEGVVKGKVEILDTPAGKIVQNLLDAGITLGISSRGVGSTRSDGDRTIVQEDFQLICFDIVSEPSTPLAFLYKEGLTRSGRQLTEEEIKRTFSKEDQVDRIYNDILSWKE